MSPRYIVITPARNEEANIGHTIRSMVAQSCRPARWVIVNDGSKDRTGYLIDAAAREHAWISTVHRPDRGARQQGGGVIETFYDGYRLIETEPWDYLVKLDGDLAFDPDYFERACARFAADERLGIGGGMIVARTNGQLVEDSPGDPSFHVRGAVKIYRRPVWAAIGGLLRAPGWDTLDELKANMLGWRTYTFRDLPVIQLKATGSADGSWKNWFKNGRANYVTGYHPLFMVVKCLKRITRPPVLVGAAGLFCGFMTGYAARVPQVDDADLVRYLRHQQLKRLLLQPSLWS